MKLLDIILEAAVPEITTNEAVQKNMFGPVFHGTSESGRENISKNGFIVVDDEKAELKANGYQASNYADGKPAPIHHLGYGVYFTTKKAIAKNYNGQSQKGLKPYYIDSQRIETINFGSPNTMMKWWVANGYDFSWDNVPGKSFINCEKERIRATKNLTTTLKSRCDAVYYKGSGLYKLLDGDQICVFNPSGKIYSINDSDVKGLIIGGKVKIKSLDEVLPLISRYVSKIRNEQFTAEVTQEDANFYIVSNYWKIPKDPKNTGVITAIHDTKFIRQYSVKMKKGGTINYPDFAIEEI